MSIDVDRTGLITSKGIYLGSIDAVGSIFSSAQEFVGEIREDGTVFSAKKRNVGSVDRDGTCSLRKKAILDNFAKTERLSQLRRVTLEHLEVTLKKLVVFCFFSLAT